MSSDDELKDEELVDFEGSDYDIDGDYEEEDSEEEKLKYLGSQKLADPRPVDNLDAAWTEASSWVTNGASSVPESSTFTSADSIEGSALEDSQFPIKSSAVAAKDGQKDLKHREGLAEPLGFAGGISKGGLQTQEANGLAVPVMTYVASSPSKAEMMQVDVAAEIRSSENLHTRLQEKGRKNVDGERVVTKNHRDCNVISGPAQNERSDASITNTEPELAEDRPGLSPNSRPDLEDGELAETAVPYLIGEEEIVDEYSGREKKRKTDVSDIGRHIDCHFLQQSEERGNVAGNQHHRAFSDKRMEHLPGLACAGGRGIGVRMIGLGQGSLTPGIMGPGRPVGPINLARLAQGFNPFGGLSQHGRPQVHLQGVLAQQPLLRARALQLAPETLATTMRSSLTHPLGALAFQPLINLNAPGLISHTPKHFLRPLPELVMRPMGNFAIGKMANSHAGRVDVPSKARGQGDTHFYNGVGRQFCWPSVAGSNEALRIGYEGSHDLRRGLCRGMTESVGAMVGSLGLAGHPRTMMRHAHLDDTILNQMSSGSLRAESDLVYNAFDVRWKIEKEKMLKHGLPTVQTTESTIVGGNSSSRRASIKDVGKPGESKIPGSQGFSTQAKLETLLNVDCAEVAAACTVIKLHQPVRKSRMLLVSGLPEDIPSSMVIEVFEKLGKVMDVSKTAKGNAFTVSYSSEMEAVTAKRNLHRTCLAGKQILIDYVHQ